MAQPRAAQPADQDTEPDSEAVARSICLRLLIVAPRTRAELAAAMRKRHVPEDAATAVLDRFGEVGLIHDAAFARAWVESRHTGRGLGRRALADELRRRGVDRDVVGEAVSALGPEEEAVAARALVVRRLPLIAGHPAERQARRLVGMLARKGYPEGLARRVVAEALREAGAELAESDDSS